MAVIELLLGVVARNVMPLTPSQIAKLRLVYLAVFLRNRAPGMEVTTRWRLDRRGNIASQDDPLLAVGRVGNGNRREQGARVWMLRAAIELFGFRELDDLAEIHD